MDDMSKAKVKKTLRRAKNHLSRQKYAYAFAGLSLVLIRANLQYADEIREFLEEKGIDPAEFFIATEDRLEEATS